MRYQQNKLHFVERHFMATMTPVDFMVALRKGKTKFSNVIISGDVSLKELPIVSLFLERVLFEGDVDFGDLVLKKLEVYHSKIVGKVTGTLKCSDTTVRSNICSYGSTIPFWFNESVIKDFFD